jgi:hypothetical protein
LCVHLIPLRLQSGHVDELHFGLSPPAHVCPLLPFSGIASFTCGLLALPTRYFVRKLPACC